MLGQIVYVYMDEGGGGVVKPLFSIPQSPISLGAGMAPFGKLFSLLTHRSPKTCYSGFTKNTCAQIGE